MLYEHITDTRFTCRFRWEPGGVAVWDNRATCHLAPTDVPVDVERRMERITLAGDVPVGPDGSTSLIIAGETPEMTIDQPAARGRRSPS